MEPTLQGSNLPKSPLSTSLWQFPNQSTWLEARVEEESIMWAVGDKMVASTKVDNKSWEKKNNIRKMTIAGKKLGKVVRK
jgi:hypothetical protein